MLPVDRVASRSCTIVLRARVAVSRETGGLGPVQLSPMVNIVLRYCGPLQGWRTNIPLNRFCVTFDGDLGLIPTTLASRSSGRGHRNAFAELSRSFKV